MTSTLMKLYFAFFLFIEVKGQANFIPTFARNEYVPILTKQECDRLRSQLYDGNRKYNDLSINYNDTMWKSLFYIKNFNETNSQLRASFLIQFSFLMDIVYSTECQKYYEQPDALTHVNNRESGTSTFFSATLVSLTSSITGLLVQAPLYFILTLVAMYAQYYHLSKKLNLRISTEDNFPIVR